MKQLLALAPFFLATALGCGSNLDSDPTVLGVGPEMRAEMRKLIKKDDPSADVEQVVEEFMEKVRAIDKMASENTDGKQNPKDYFAKIDTAENAGEEVLKLVDEFAIRLPSWIDPLVNECQAGEISKEHEKLLARFVIVELISQLSG